jgi:hypothetical protein
MNRPQKLDGKPLEGFDRDGFFTGRVRPIMIALQFART